MNSPAQMRMITHANDTGLTAMDLMYKAIKEFWSRGGQWTQRVRQNKRKKPRKTDMPLSYFLNRLLSKLHARASSYRATKHYKDAFTNIYRNRVWNNNDPNIPLSGPGSSLNATREISSALNNFIYNNNCRSILDLGCGDLTWISKTPFFSDPNIQYTGVDIVEMLIKKHIEAHLQKTFICADITNYYHGGHSSLLIIRDVVFHLKLADILRLFNNIKGSFDYVAVTSCNNKENSDNLNEWHFAERNLSIPPFNMSPSALVRVDEPEFNRMFYIVSHDNFYNAIV
jgi:SAM-dependent methyltransferase